MAGIPYGKIKKAHFSTTTSATANSTVPAKEIIPSDFTGAYRNAILGLIGEGVYVEGADVERDGINFPTAVQEILATNPAAAKVVRLTDTLYVALTHVADAALGAYAITISGTTATVGTVAAVNAVDTDSIDICRLSDTHFATAYRDEGGADYLCARIGSVSGTTITMGTEKEMTAAAITEDSLAICTPTDGVIAIAYADGDDDTAVIAAPYTGTTVGTLGSVVEFDAAAPTDISCCRMQSGYIFVCYTDAGGSLYGRVASVSTAGAIGTPGTEKAIVAFIPTYLNAVYVEENKVIIGYEDNANDVEAVACTTVSGATTITAGTATNFSGAISATDVGLDMIDNTQGIIKWDDGTRGNAVRFSISGTTITADATIDWFTETATAGGGEKGIACATNGKCVIVYEDADNDLGVLVGQYYEDRIIDIRSTATSAAAQFDVAPVFEREATI